MFGPDFRRWSIGKKRYDVAMPSSFGRCLLRPLVPSDSDDWPVRKIDWSFEPGRIFKKVRIWYFARPWGFVLGRLLTYVIYNNRHRMKRYERYQSNNSMWTNDLDWGCSFWRGRGRSTQLLQIHFLCHPKYCVIAILQPGRHHHWYQGICVFYIYMFWIDNMIYFPVVPEYATNCIVLYTVSIFIYNLDKNHDQFSCL